MCIQRRGDEGGDTPGPRPDTWKRKKKKKISTCLNVISPLPSAVPQDGKVRERHGSLASAPRPSSKAVTSQPVTKTWSSSHNGNKVELNDANEKRNNLTSPDSVEPVGI